MQAIEPVAITAENFAAFGRYYNLREGEGMGEPISKEPLKIGATAVLSGPFASVKMERHVLSEELLICGDDDMVLTVADSDPEGAPRSDDVRAFIMKPGAAVVLGQGIWHDANHGLHRDTTYFFLIPQRDFVASEVRWTNVVPEAVPVEWNMTAAGEPTRPIGAFADSSAFAPYGRLTRVLEGPGLAGDNGWRSWLEEAPALEGGCCLDIGFPETGTGGNMDCTPQARRQTLCTGNMDCAPQSRRQILCACGSINLKVMLPGQPESAKTFALSQGDYALLEKNVCYQVLEEPGQSGYYYTLSPHTPARNTK